MKNLVIAVTALLLLSGCRKEALPEPLSATVSQDPEMVQKVRLEYPVVLNSRSEPDKFSLPLQCLPTEYGIRLLSEATLAGTMTYVGEMQPRSRLYIKQCNMGAGVSSFSTQGRWELNTLTGDQLILIAEERVSLISGTLAGTLTISGGTGRFSGATGSLSVRGSVDLKTGVAKRTGTGMMAFRDHAF